MEEKEKMALIKYRLDQAAETIREVDQLVEINLLHVAVNRIYYGIFYCLSALSLKYGFTSSKHLLLIGWFNQNFIKTGLLEIRYGRILRDAFKNRSEGDYLPFTVFKADEVKAMREEMEDFIHTLTSFIKIRDDLP